MRDADSSLASSLAAWLYLPLQAQGGLCGVGGRRQPTDPPSKWGQLEPCWQAWKVHLIATS